MEQFVNAVLLTVGLGAVIGILCTLLGLIRGKNAPEDPKADPAEEAPARTAVVCCTGIDQVCSRKNDYQGPASCAAASTLFGGPLTCPNACLGGGDCRDACPEKAIVLRNGLAVVDRSRCTGCGRCTDACPRGLIKLMPQRPCAYVACSISTAGSEGSGACTAGCDGCGLCSVVCPKGAVRTSGRLPSIDPDLCDGCGICARSCPRNLIHILS